MKTTRYLDICTLDGKVLFSFCLTEREGNEPFPTGPAKPVQQNGHPPTNGHTKTNGNGSDKGLSEEKMTDPQQRKLFRILAEQGMEAEKAHKELLKRFKVSDLKEIGKMDASRMIDTMLKEAKGAE